MWKWGWGWQGVRLLTYLDAQNVVSPHDDDDEDRSNLALPVVSPAPH